MDGPSAVRGEENFTMVLPPSRVSEFIPDIPNVVDDENKAESKVGRAGSPALAFGEDPPQKSKSTMRLDSELGAKLKEMHLLDGLDVNDDGDIDIHELLLLVKNKRSAEETTRFTKRLMFGLLIAVFFIVVCSSIVTIVSIDLAKDAYVKNSRMVDDTGGIVQTSNADVKLAADGTAMVRGSCTTDGNGEKCAQAAKTSLTKTLVPLVDLPRQSMQFLEAMDQVMYTRNSSVIMKKLTGFEWHSPSHMEMQLAGNGDARLFIKNGTAWIVDMQTARTQILQQNRRPSGRRLQGSLANRTAFTYAELVERYNHETSLLDVDSNWRRLNAVDTTGLADMAAWFGAIFRSDISTLEANAQAMQEHIDSSGCDVGPPSQPNVGTSGFMLFKLRQQFDEEATMGSTQLLYFGLKGTPKFKLAQRATLSFDRDSWLGGVDVNETWPGTIAVTEGIGSQTFDYEIWHPAHPLLGPSYYCNDERIDTVVAADKSGLLAAMHVLQSSDYRSQKDSCNVRPPQDTSNGPDSSGVVLDFETPFDCQAQLFRWRVEGWVLEVRLDGEIVGLVSGDGEQRFHVEEVILNLSSVAFNGCSPGSSNFAQCPNTTYRRLDEFHPAAARRLGAWTRFQQWASNTLWCGAGTDTKNTACPSDEADRACHRHDHGEKVNGVIGGMATRLGCDIDRGLADRSTNVVVQAVFGRWGIAQTWGCYDNGTYNCWKKKRGWLGSYWSYGAHCDGEHTHYGPFRYSSYSHSYGWKKQDPPDRCDNPLSWCTGCI